MLKNEIAFYIPKNALLMESVLYSMHVQQTILNNKKLIENSCMVLMRFNIILLYFYNEKFALAVPLENILLNRIAHFAITK